MTPTCTMKHLHYVHVCLFTVTDVELKRLKDAFKRTSGLSAYMTQQCFYKEVLGDGVPPKVAEVNQRANTNTFLSALITSTTKKWFVTAVNVLSITIFLSASEKCFTLDFV